MTTRIHADRFCVVLEVLGRQRRVRFADGAETVVPRDDLRAPRFAAELAAMSRGARRMLALRIAGRCRCGKPSSRSRCFKCRRKHAAEQAARDARKEIHRG